MMPELGKYAATVLSAYGVSIFLLAVLVGLSIHRSGKIKRQLEKTERKAKKNG